MASCPDHCRILEIVRSRDGEDDDDEDAKADDSDQASDSIEVDLQDSGQTPLAFQERSLREYFQAVDVDEKGLRTPPAAAHLTILEMAADLLFEAGDSLSDDEQPKLLSYAADFWAQHFVEIDLSKATDEEVRRVINILHKLLNNYNNVSRNFEHFAGSSYSGMMPESGAPWLDTVREWAGRATSSTCAGLLTPEVNVWAKEIISSREPLLVLAHGHVLNWYKYAISLSNRSRILSKLAITHEHYLLYFGKSSPGLCRSQSPSSTLFFHLL